MRHSGHELNRDSYNRIAAAWDQARAGLPDRERPYLEAFLDGLAAPSAILDLGCGTGRPIAEHLLARGHRVTGVDQADELLAIARARFPAATWIRSRLEDFEFAGRYAGVILWDALFHLERASHRRVLSGAAQCLDTGGRLLLSVGGSSHAPFTDTMLGATFFYDSHAPDTVLGVLRELGFVPVLGEFIDLPTAGRDKGRYAIVARLTARQRSELPALPARS